MKSPFTLDLRIGNIELGATEFQLKHSFGFLVLQDVASMEAELERVSSDIELLEILDTFGITQILLLARKSADEATLVNALMNQFGCSQEIATMIADMEVTALSNDSSQGILPTLRT